MVELPFDFDAEGEVPVAPPSPVPALLVTRLLCVGGGLLFSDSEPTRCCTSRRYDIDAQPADASARRIEIVFALPDATLVTGPLGWWPFCKRERIAFVKRTSLNLN